MGQRLVSDAMGVLALVLFSASGCGGTSGGALSGAIADAVLRGGIQVVSAARSGGVGAVSRDGGFPSATAAPAVACHEDGSCPMGAHCAIAERAPIACHADGDCHAAGDWCVTGACVAEGRCTRAVASASPSVQGGRGASAW